MAEQQNEKPPTTVRGRRPAAAAETAEANAEAADTHAQQAPDPSLAEVDARIAAAAEVHRGDGRQGEERIRARSEAGLPPVTVGQLRPNPPAFGVARQRAEREDLVDAIVVADGHMWLEPKPGTKGLKPEEIDHHRGFRGDAVRVTPDELERGRAYGSLVSPDEVQVVHGQVASLAGPAAGDTELAKLDAPDLIGFLIQNPEQAKRVFDFESANQARPQVLRATGLYDERGLDGPGTAPGTGITHNGG